jgi:oligopeptide/dipeptide ABC transporter ATP-binding protein
VTDPAVPLQPVLAADDLRVRLPARPGATPSYAVDGVNLELTAGEILAVVGESGCGKTTLARTLLGLIRPAAGEIRLDGVALQYSSRALRAYRRRVQLVPQDPSGSLNPRHTVYLAVAEGLRIHTRRTIGRRPSERATVAAALSRAGLRPPDDFIPRYPHELSEGQCQRVAIAGALAVGPQVLVADEPVSSLDAPVRGEILRLLLQLRHESGLAAVVFTHDLSLAWNLADCLAVMYLGRFVEIGPVETVLHRPAHPYTQALLSAVHPPAGQLPVLLSGEPADASTIPSGCRFHPRCPVLAAGTAAAAGVADACRTVDLPVLPEGPTWSVACHYAARTRRGLDPQR